MSPNQDETSNEEPEGLVIIREIIKKIHKLGKKFIFRGENKDYGEVSSTLYRFHEDILKDDQFRSQIMSIMQENIINNAKGHLKSNRPTADILAELQHYKGKTTLIDFSRDVYIALFFACHGEPKKDETKNDKCKDDETKNDKPEDGEPKKDETKNYDGRLILYHYEEISQNVEDDDFEKQKDFCFEHKTKETNNRTIFQKSVFVHAHQGTLTVDKKHIINIEEGHKPKILDYLKKHHDIHESTIYNDLAGFIDNENNFGTADKKFIKGLSEQNKGDQEKAIRHYKEAIKIKPNYYDAYNNKGLAYANSKEKDYKKAIECYNKALEIKPDKYEAYNNMGNAYNGLGESKKAIECYERALEIKPDKHEAHYNMGNAYASLKDYKKAIECYERALEIKPDKHEAHHNMGVAYKNLGQPDKAAECFKKAREIESQRLDAEPN